MTRAFYYASTVRNAKDIAQYLLHPMVKVGAHMALLPGAKSQRHAQASAESIASVVGGLAYMSTTTAFNGFEAQFLDNNARNAVAAELGKKPEDIKFSDYLDSDNSIVKHELHDAKHVNQWRYATDALFFIPALMHGAAKIAPDKIGNLYEKGRFSRTSPGKDAKASELLVGAFNFWDMAIYGSKAAYWAYETFLIDKSAHYELVKVAENIESVGKKFSPNDLIAVLNRSRNDQGLSQIREKDEREALWPILEHLADQINHSESFGVPELLYLVGLNKINIFELDEKGKEVLDPETGERHISQEAIKQTYSEIDRVGDIGLAGIAEEKREAQQKAFEKGMTNDIKTQFGGVMSVDELSRKPEVSQGQRRRADLLYNVSTSVSEGVRGFFGGNKSGGYAEYISSRDGGEVPSQAAV